MAKLVEEILVHHHGRSIKEKIMDSTNKGINKDDCWTWKGELVGSTHTAPMISDRFGNRQSVLRIVYEYFYGEVPEGKKVYRSCKNPLCVNKNHLYIDNNGERYSYIRGIRKHPNYKGDIEKLKTGEEMVKISVDIKIKYGEIISQNPDILSKKWHKEITQEDVILELSKEYNLTYWQTYNIITGKTWKNSDGYIKNSHG